VFGVVTGVSVGKLLLGGIVPGVLTSLAYIAVIIILSFRGRGFGPSERAAIGSARLAPLGFREYFGVFAGLLLFLIVVGGLYTGTFTPTEAGSMAAFATLILSAIFLFLTAEAQPVRHVIRSLGASFREAGSFTAMIFAIVVGATLFTHYLLMAGIPDAITDWVMSLPVSPGFVVVLFLLLLIPLGSLVDGLSMLLIVAPITYPTVAALGYDGVWYGILFVKLIEIGLLHPPLGLNVYVVCSLFPDLRPERVFIRILPFLLAELVVIVMIFAYPDMIGLLQGHVSSH
jgi:C4-dicarboxylate transporter, DctM subunit